MSSPRQYEDARDALNQSIAETGVPRKAIAAKLYPGRKLSTAESLFSRMMSPENLDVNLTAEAIETIIEETRPEDYVFYLCDKYGLERPKRKPGAVETDIRLGLQNMQKQMVEMMGKLERLERERNVESPLYQAQRDVDEIAGGLTKGIRNRK